MNCPKTGLPQGTLDLLILTVVALRPIHGYAIAQRIQQGSRDVLQVQQGCGAGRFTEILLAQGARVTSVDLNNAVDANARNFPITDRHSVLQADILALPFAPRSFDMVLCLGVVQHTPKPEVTIGSVYEHVHEGGGALVVDH